jgi:hypothetical protein
VFAANELLARGHADLHRQFGRQLVAIGETADAIGTKIFPGHDLPSCVPAAILAPNC